MVILFEGIVLIGFFSLLELICGLFFAYLCVGVLFCSPDSDELYLLCGAF